MTDTRPESAVPPPYQPEERRPMFASGDQPAVPPPVAPLPVVGAEASGADNAPDVDLTQPVPASPAAAPAAAAVVAQPAAAQSEPSSDGTTSAHLDASGVSMWFSGRKVLEGCSLSMEPSMVTALIGPSGCGKSTFLRSLNRMHELVPGAQLAGDILLDGVDIYSEDINPTEVRRRIGMVFQKPNPFPSMSIADNVLAGLELSGTKTPDPKGLVEECLRRAGLWEEVKTRLNEGGMSLSGGQQQRLCIARSLAVKPDVLLMDEPCSALDPISTRVIEQTIRELCNDITIVIVTHNLQQAQRVSDNCAFFLVEEFGKPGRIVESGPTERLFSNPSDPRTLDYVTGRFG